MAEPNDGRTTEEILGEIYTAECDEFASVLYLCAQAEAHGESIVGRFADFFDHRGGCRRCQETYEDVLMLLDIEFTKGLAHISLTDTLTLPGKIEVGADWREALPRGREWLLETTQRGMQLVIEMALLVWGTDQPSLALRQEEDERVVLGELTVAPSQSEIGFGVEVRLRLLPDVEDPALALLVAEISLPDRWPDFSGVVVVLYLPNGERQRATTEPTGIVRFPRLARQLIPRMRFAVELPYDSLQTSPISA